MAYQLKTLAEGSLMKSTIIKRLFGGEKISKKLNYKTLQLIRRSFKQNIDIMWGSKKHGDMIKLDQEIKALYRGIKSLFGDE